MKKFENLRVMELLCSRICHDLVSPVSAINNGLEFLDPTETDLFQTSLKLIHTSARHAVERLSFFRLIFGTGGDSDHFSWTQIYAALQLDLGSRRISFESSAESMNAGLKLPRNTAKALMVGVLVMADCLPRGGVIKLSSVNWTTLEGTRISAQGDRCGLRQDVKSGLNIKIKQADLTVRNVIAHLAVVFFDHAGKTLELKQISETEIELIAI